jgi:hypothetical protein
MKFGDMQSVLQITVAINLAYFSFREIRAPALAGYLKLYRATRALLTETRTLALQIERPAVLEYGDEASSLYNKRYVHEGALDLHDRNLDGLDDPYSANMHAFDRGVRVAAITIAGFGFLLLCVASAFADSNVPIYVFIAATGISVLPAAASIFYNLVIIKLLHIETANIEGVRNAVQAIKDEFVTDCLPRYRKLMQETKRAKA